jgi:hypothetical protein
VANKNQLLALAKKNNVKVTICFGEDYVIELDACNRKFLYHCADGHGVTACGENATEAYTDAHRMIKYGFEECNGCEDSYCNLTDEQVQAKLN